MECGSRSPRDPLKQGPGKVDSERDQEETGKLSLEHTEGALEAPVGYPKGRPCPFPMSLHQLRLVGSKAVSLLSGGT